MVTGSVHEVVNSDQDIILVKWSGNKTVNLASNYVGEGKLDNVKRWDKKEVYRN